MNKTLKNLLVKLENPRVLMSVVSGVMLILTSTKVIDVTTEAHANLILNTVLSVLVGLGILTDPLGHVKPTMNQMVDEVQHTVDAVAPANVSTVVDQVAPVVKSVIQDWHVGEPVPADPAQTTPTQN